jgi:HSP20 family molecular chaperone IbpA
VRSALASVPGVDENDVTVDRTAKTATVVLDGEDAPTTEALLAALEKTKFKAKVRQ